MSCRVTTALLLGCECAKDTPAKMPLCAVCPLKDSHGLTKATMAIYSDLRRLEVAWRSYQARHRPSQLTIFDC
jgi:hypothetical protein